MYLPRISVRTVIKGRDLRSTDEIRLRQMELADEPQSNAPWLSSAARHPWRSLSGFGHPTDSFGRCVPILAAASRSLAGLLAVPKLDRVR